MSKLGDAFEAWKKDIDKEPFNSGELDKKAQEQAAKRRDEKRK
ncbi:hypothetical protein ACFWY9_28765 [Amycolatopsis sp. NPDC059027]